MSFWAVVHNSAMTTCLGLSLFGGRGSTSRDAILGIGAHDLPCGILLLKAPQKALYHGVCLRSNLFAAVRQHGHQTVEELPEVIVRVTDSDFGVWRFDTSP